MKNEIKKLIMFWFSFYSLFGVWKIQETKPKQVIFFHFWSFLTVYLLFKYRFVAW